MNGRYVRIINMQVSRLHHDKTRLHNTPFFLSVCISFSMKVTVSIPLEFHQYSVMSLMSAP